MRRTEIVAGRGGLTLNSLRVVNLSPVTVAILSHLSFSLSLSLSLCLSLPPSLPPSPPLSLVRLSNISLSSVHSSTPSPRAKDRPGLSPCLHLSESSHSSESILAHILPSHGHPLTTIFLVISLPAFIRVISRSSFSPQFCPRTHARTHARTHTHTKTRTHIHTCTHTHALTHTLTHTHSLTHSHTHTHTHTHTCSHKGVKEKGRDGGAT